jgi:hypothetical protein
VRAFKLTLIATLCLMTHPAKAAGFHLIQVPTEEGYPGLQAAVWSPCQQQIDEVKLPKTTLPATLDCVVSGEKLPLIVIFTWVWRISFEPPRHR